MAKMNWTKNTANRKIDHYQDEIDRRLLSLEKSQEKINLGIHKDHDCQTIIMETGPHAAKVICVDCDGKFVTWLSKDIIKQT